jgi:6-phospho-3-hexuloisomerase
MAFKKILKELENNLKKVDKKDLKNFIFEIKKAKRVYVVGAGRSGLIAKSLAMRLVRVKKKTFVIGETVTPPIQPDNLVIAVSGSGETVDTLTAVKVSRVLGARILGITAVKDSPLAKLSHVLVLIPANVPVRLGSQYQLRELIGEPERPPIKSLFEMCTLILIELAVSKLNSS